MSKPQLIARQSAHPRGLLGHFVARAMALDTAAANRLVLSALEPKPRDRILDLGCGHGRGLRRVADRMRSGIAIGVDPSEVMRAVARRHNRKWIRSGRVRVEAGTAECIPALDDDFDKAFSVHTTYFWPDFEAGLREIRRVLRPGGELFLVFHSSENRSVAASLPSSVYTLRSADEVSRALRRCGYRDAEIRVDPATSLHLVRAAVSPLWGACSRERGIQEKENLDVHP